MTPKKRGDATQTTESPAAVRKKARVAADAEPDSDLLLVNGKDLASLADQEIQMKESALVEGMPALVVAEEAPLADLLVQPTPATAADVRPRPHEADAQEVADDVAQEAGAAGEPKQAQEEAQGVDDAVGAVDQGEASVVDLVAENAELRQELHKAKTEAEELRRQLEAHGSQTPATAGEQEGSSVQRLLAAAARLFRFA